MKIAILGSNGFIGSSLSQALRPKHTITDVSRQTLDLLDSTDVVDWLENNKFDVIINAAAVMNNTATDAHNNLGLFMNFFNAPYHFGRFINLGSGAEFDRRHSIDNAAEEDIFKVLPTDSYGFGQNIKSRLCYERDNFYTLRIFNCFGTHEADTRILKRPEFKITDRYFDYFGIDDLITVVEHYLTADNLPKDINCVYENKIKVSDFVKLYCSIKNDARDIDIVEGIDINYTGRAKNLSKLKLNLLGVEKCLMNY